MATIAERIKKALKLRGMKQIELSERTGISKSSISTYLSGEYEPKQANIMKIAQALEVDEAWLMGRNVPMNEFEFKWVEPIEISYPPIKIDYNEFIVKKYGEGAINLLNSYNLLNCIGKKEANKRIEELTYLDKYCTTEDIIDIDSEHRLSDD